MRNLKKSAREKLWKGTQGAISILLACLMLPFFSLAAVLMEAGRYQSAVRGLDQAIGNSAYSTLAGYDSYLLDRFGLLAVKQSTDDVDEELTGTLTSYLDKQNTTDMRAVDVTNVSVNGVYPLSDINVMKQQIQNSSCVIAPAKLVMEGLDLDSLVSQIEKSMSFLKIIEQFTAGVDLLDKEVTLLESLEDAKDQIKQVGKDEEAYNEAFTDWQTAVNELIAHLNTTRPDEEKEANKAKKWDNDLKAYREAAEKARAAYETAVTTLYKSLDTLQEDLNSVLNANASFQTQIVSFASNSASAYIDADLDENASDELKTFANNVITMEKSLETGAKSLNGSFSNITKGFSMEKLAKAVSDLLDTKNAVSAYNTNGVTASSSVPSHGSYHYADLEGLTDPDAIDEMLKDAQSQAESSGWLDMLLSLVEVFNSLVKSETFADAELNVLLDMDYYEDTYGGLPSQKQRADGYSNPYEKEDELLSMEYLAEIDPDYDPDDPYGISGSSLASKLDAVIESFNDWKDDIQDLKDADWFVDKCKAAIAVVKSMIQIFKNLKNLFVSVLEASNMNQKLLTCTYLAYSLPNRTNFETGTSLTGYSFAKISRPAAQTGSNIPYGGDLLAVSGGDVNYSFRGAELEYIIWGDSYERNNQVRQFWMIYLMRLLINLPFILSNAEVSQMVSTVSAVPYVGPVLGVILELAICIDEPFFDTYILVNGGDVTVNKSTIYCTPSGIPKLIESMVSMKLTKACKESIAKELSEAYGIEYKAPSSSTTTNNTKKPLIDTDKYGQELLSFDYTQHCLFLMILFGSEKTYLNRLTDLVQCEMTMRNHLDKASTSQQISGEYTAFDIDQAFTTLRIEVDATMNQVLPVSNFSDDGVLSIGRVLYRGY